MSSPEEDRKKMIIKKLHISVPDYVFTRKLSDLLTLPIRELQETLRRIKSENAESRILIDFIRTFHHIQFIDRNIPEALSDVFVSHAVRRAMEFEKNGQFAPASALPLLGYVLAIHEGIDVNCEVRNKAYLNTVNSPSDSQTFFNYLEEKGAVILCETVTPKELSVARFPLWNCQLDNKFSYVEKVFTRWNTATALLVALDHVNAGIGTDLGASLILDAQYLALSALNLTADRVSQSPFQTGLHKAHASIMSVGLGPIAHRVESFLPLAKAIVEYNQVDLRLVNKPWKEDISPPKKIGVLVEWRNLCDLEEKSQKAYDFAKKSLIKKNFELVPFDISSLARSLIVHCFALVLKTKSESKSRNLFWIREYLAPFESLEESMAGFFLDKLLAAQLRFSSNLFKRMNHEALQIAKQYEQSYIVSQIDLVRQKVFEKMKALDITAFLCPANIPPIYGGYFSDVPLQTAYSWIWSFLRFPCGTIAITEPRLRVSEATVANSMPVSSNVITKDVHHVRLHGTNLPSVEVVGLPWNDEMIIDILQTLEDEKDLTLKPAEDTQQKIEDR